LRICVYDNLANNAYIVTKMLRNMGYDAELGLNPEDTFPMSQPFWEDLDLEMEMDQSSNSSIEFWLAFEKEKGWKRPSWVRYIGSSNPSTQTMLKNNLGTACLHPLKTLGAISRSQGGFYDAVHAILNIRKANDLSHYDLIIAYGLGPSLALLAGKKYISIPYGGDLLSFPFQQNHSNWVLRARANLQRKAYQKSELILVAMPDFVNALKQIGAPNNWEYYAYPIDIAKYHPLENQHLDDLVDSETAKRARDKIILLMPSRLDFETKGSDKAIKAFGKLLKQRSDVFLVLMNWGSDIAKTQRLASDLRIEEHIYFHPYVVSKPRLIRFINSSDLVLDQFGTVVGGAYGTTTIETMACAKPLITHIDWEKYAGIFSRKPPVMSAFTEEEILEAMILLCRNNEAREKLGNDAKEWIIENHSNKNLSKILKFMIS